MTCMIHPSQATATTIAGRQYCARCQADQQSAAAQLDPHVTPKPCFVWYTGSQGGWQPIAGTGCAHYVSHQLGIRRGSAGECCLEGYCFRVPVVILGRVQVTGGLTSVQVNDIWVSAARDHTGLVTSIVPPAATRPAGGAANPVIWITHASSAQHALATNRFDTYFHGGGDFFR